MTPKFNRHPASFRDPAGFVFEQGGIYYRYISKSYAAEYTHLLSSGLYKRLKELELILPFEERACIENDIDCHAILAPQQIPFLNYAWEWSFEQLKDAALSTLQICLTALEHGMILKDATHLNIQFVNGQPQLIDTISFDFYEEGNEWIAYRQFCECFLNPLLLGAYCGLEVHSMVRAWPEGIPASLTSSLLPFRSKFNLSVLLHVSLQAKFSPKQNRVAPQRNKKKLGKSQLIHILHNLKSCITKLQLPKQQTTWSRYYEETILSQDYLANKKEVISKWLHEIDFYSAIDYGANKGEFSELCLPKASVVAVDVDSQCINDLYKKTRQKSSHGLLPLVIDLGQPSAATGWCNLEQKAFLSRKYFDLGLALALVHHLALGKNIPLEMVASFFASQVNYLIIEFVPKTDAKVQEMLLNRKDIFRHYTIHEFETQFSGHFKIIRKEIISGSERTVYLMENLHQKERRL